LRGIIVNSANIYLHPNGFKISSAIDEIKMKYFILYWDKIVIPANNFFYVQVPYEQELLKTNIIERPKIKLSGSFSGNDLGQTIIKEEINIISDKLKDYKNEWIIHQFAFPNQKELILPLSNHKLIEKKILKFELLNALPVPKTNVNLFELIDFKIRRKNEFDELHNLIDELYLDIINSGDPHLQTYRSYEKLKEKLKDIETLQTEKFGKLSKYFDLTIGFNLKDILMVSGFIDLMNQSSSHFLSYILIGASMVNISLQKEKTIKNDQHKNDFDIKRLSYISKAKMENIIS